MDKDMTTPNINASRIKQYLEEGKRFDGRKLDEFREIIIETNVSKKAEGSARVKIGKTEVIAGVKLDVGTPYPDSPDKGNLSVAAELLPLSSPRFEPGPPRFEAIELARVVDRGIRESKFIEFEKLCIKKGEKVWTVFIDIYSINDDGNLIDAAAIASVVALKEAKMPKYDEETEKVSYGEWTTKKLPLSKNVPIAITVHKIGKSLVVDPSKEEEDVSDVRMTVGSHDGVIASIQKGNSESLTFEEIGEILDIVEKVWKDIFKNLSKNF